MNRFFTFLFACAAFSTVSLQAETLNPNFELLDLSDMLTEPETAWTGDTVNGTEGVNDYGDPTYTMNFSDAVYSFNNSYSKSPYGNYWSGFAYANTSDVTTANSSNVSSITGRGYEDGLDDVYVTAFITDANPAVIKFLMDEQFEQLGMYVTNSTYAYLSMKNGDAYAKKFGGDDGSDPDWFKLTAIGYSLAGDSLTETSIYLADFRSDNPAEDYIVNEWKWFDLSSLGSVGSIRFALSSSDSGDWGMNTPAYFCLDGLRGINSEYVSVEDGVEESDGRAYYANGTLYLDGFAGAAVRVINMTGVTVSEWNVESDTEALPVVLGSGNYIIQSVKDGSTSTQKISVQ